jgi:hypothetical protein
MQRDTQFSIRIPQPLWIFVVAVALLLAGLTIRVWHSNQSNKRTVSRFLLHARNGDISACRAMLAEGQSTVWLLDPHALRVAANRPITTDPQSFVDFVVGRQCFRADLAYANDHSLTVERGRVILGSAFWIQYVPPGPGFSSSTSNPVSTELGVPPSKTFERRAGICMDPSRFRAGHSVH